ncbi:MAG: hypothetical protein ACR2P0_18265 [Acidimicrobiales bacterium]
MKKGRHRRFEEARALKRSQDVDLENLFESIAGDSDDSHKPEHDAWADVAEEWQSRDSDEDAADDEEDGAEFESNPEVEANPEV